MHAAVLVLALGMAAPSAQARQNATPRPQPAVQRADPIAEAYDQFLLAQRLEDDDDTEGAIAAYKRAMTLDPSGADVASGLADLYMRHNRAPEAIAAAEQALKSQPANRDAHRVLGTIYASMATRETPPGRGSPDALQQSENLTKAIQHLEQAIDRPVGEADMNVRAMLARLYSATGGYDKAIPILAELVKEEPGWQDGVALLAEAYLAAGRAAEAIQWLEEAAAENPQLAPTLADFYGQANRWRDAAGAYERALRASPRNFDLRVRYASALLNAGELADIIRARDVLREALATRANDERALFLLTQAERRSGDLDAAENTARRLVAQNGRSARAWAALAETLEERQRYQGVVDALSSAMGQFRSGPNSSSALGLLLPHLGFAYQQLGQLDKAISTFEEARKSAPGDPVATSYLIQAHLAAKHYATALDLARTARAAHPEDFRLARLEAQALRQTGKADQGIALLEAVLQQHADDPAAHIALAQLYADANRGAQAVKVLQDAQGRFPAETSIAFELGAVYDKQKRYADAESVFRQVLTREPENAAALNYLGYMLAERGERLDESVGLINRALQIEPENGSYLDSLGWAYYKSGKLNLALDNLKRAADQLAGNSVIQDHYGDALFKSGRYDDAVAAWTRALAGDGDSIQRDDIDKKIKSARQKLPKR